MAKIKQENLYHNPIFAQRVEKEIQEWLKKEKKNYKSWNLFFKEIKKRYGNKEKI